MVSPPSPTRLECLIVSFRDGALIDSTRHGLGLLDPQRAARRLRQATTALDYGTTPELDYGTTPRPARSRSPGTSILDHFTTPLSLVPPLRRLHLFRAHRDALRQLPQIVQKAISRFERDIPAPDPSGSYVLLPTELLLLINTEVDDS